MKQPQSPCPPGRGLTGATGRAGVSSQLCSAQQPPSAWELQAKTFSGNKCPHLFLSKSRKRVSLHKRKKNYSWVMGLCWCPFSSAARRLENMLVFQMVFKVGVESFPFCIWKLEFFTCTFVLQLHGHTTHFPVCLHCIFLLSLMNHAVEIPDNIKHIKIGNATRSIITQTYSILLLLIYYFNFTTSVPENVLRDTFILVKV